MTSTRTHLARALGAVTLFGLSLAAVQPSLAHAADTAAAPIVVQQNGESPEQQGDRGKLTGSGAPSASQSQGSPTDSPDAMAMFQACVVGHMRMGMDEESAKRICLLKLIAALEQREAEESQASPQSGPTSPQSQESSASPPKPAEESAAAPAAEGSGPTEIAGIDVEPAQLSK